MGVRRPSQFPEPERTVRGLLRDVCVNWGFCLSPTDTDRIATLPTLTAESFAAEVLRAEGMTPEHQPEHVKRLVERFTACVGSRTLPAADDPAGDD